MLIGKCIEFYSFFFQELQTFVSRELIERWITDVPNLMLEIFG